MALGSILGKSTTTWSNSEILSSETAALFDLGSDAVPDDMLNALAHTGDLHVWKRTQNGVVDYPVSPNPDAYQVGDNTIEYVGQLGDKARVEFGSYVGTGTAGAGNKNKLTFSSPPKLVSIGDGGGNNAGGGFAWVNGSIRVYSDPSSVCKLTWDGNTLYWYAENSQSSAQYNNSGTIYHYAAIL